MQNQVMTSSYEKRSSMKGRNEVGWRPGKKQVWRPMFEFEVSRKQMYCIEESTCDIAGTFRRPPAVIRRPHSDSRRIVPPCPPRYGPGSMT